MENDNIFKQLENFQVPVSNKEWDAIVKDQKLVDTFGKKNFLRTTAGKITVAVASVILATSTPFIVYKYNNSKETAKTTIEKNENIDNINTICDTLTLPSKKNETIETNNKPNYQKNISATEKIISTTNSIKNTIAEPNIIENSFTTITNKTSEEIMKEENIYNSKQKLSTSQEITQLNLNNKSHSESITTENQNFDSPMYDENNIEFNTEISEKQFFIPSAFTPNGDGLNDIFYAKANFEPNDYEILIFSRNGDLVFRSKDINIGWDGQFQGKTLPNGVYIYNLRYKKPNNKEEKLQGQVLLIH